MLCNLGLNAAGILASQLALQPRGWASTAVTHHPLGVAVVVHVRIAPLVVTALLVLFYANDAGDACNACFNLCNE